jgi:hypothetical protein
LSRRKHNNRDVSGGISVATECVTKVVAADSDVRVRFFPKPGGRRLKMVVEYDADVVESVQVIEHRVDKPAARPS